MIDNTGHRLTNGFLLPDFQSTDAGLDVEIEYSFFDLAATLGPGAILLRGRRKGLEHSNNRSHVTLETAFAFTRKISVRGLVAWQRTHGGLRLGSFPPADLVFPGEANTADLFEQHDRLIRDNNWRTGAGLAYSLSSVDVFVVWLEYVAGTDTHSGRAFTAGLSWPFELGSARPSRRRPID